MIFILQNCSNHNNPMPRTGSMLVLRNNKTVDVHPLQPSHSMDSIQFSTKVPPLFYTSRTLKKKNGGYTLYMHFYKESKEWYNLVTPFSG